MEKKYNKNWLNEICGHCGCTLVSHSATDYYSTMYKMHVPFNYCPSEEGGTNWDKGPGTVFKPTDTYKEEEAEDETKPS